MSFWHVMFHWPDGGIYSNILASLIVGVALYFWKGRKWLKQLELHHQKIGEMHSFLFDDPHDHLQQEPPSSAGSTSTVNQP